MGNYYILIHHVINKTVI